MAGTIQRKLMMIKKIATDFSKEPFGRSKEDGTYNGTRFREQFLKLWVKQSIELDEKLSIDLDDLDIPMTSSFMEESFGGMIRFGYVEKKQLLSLLSFQSEDSSYEIEIRSYIDEAEHEPKAEIYKF